MPESKLAKFIEHTLLKPEATAADIQRLCKEARTHNFQGVCVNGSHIQTACAHLTEEENGPRVVTVIGFPLGADTPAAKAFAAREAAKLGAAEIDMVINVGALKARDHKHVLDDVRLVVEASGGALVKVIIETILLDEQEKVMACVLAKGGGAHFVKTSTGFQPGGGATVEDVRLMRSVVGPTFGVKASGGIKSATQAWQLIEAGATRLGTSSSIALVTDES